VVVDGVGLLPAAAVALAAGTSAWLAIRPEHVRVLEPGDPTAVLTGVVEDTQFQGGLSNVAVEVAGLAAPVLATQQGVARVTRGTPVALTWDPAKAVVLPGE
jgi:spermidine/putrescine transport system ATP-binding protein/putrescine transport system ATP-binding protein